MVAVVMFFAFSCLFTLSPQNMADAKAQNIPVLSYRRTTSPRCPAPNPPLPRCLNMARQSLRWWRFFKSFFGHYLGTLEGLNGLVLKFGYKGDKTRVSSGKLNTISMIFLSWAQRGLSPTPARTFST